MYSYHAIQTTYQKKEKRTDIGLFAEVMDAKKPHRKGCCDGVF